MGIGDVAEVDSALLEDCWYVDTGMYDVAGYGAAYLLAGERPAFVETGIGTNHERVLGLLEVAGVDPEDVAYICPTHVHLDHAGGAGFLAEACPDAKVAVHERGAPHLVDPDRLVAGTKSAVEDQWRYYVEPRPVPPDRIVALADGDRLDLGERTLEAVAAPGHAHHQHAFHVPEADAVFTADAAGLYDPTTDAVHPTTPPPEFDLEQCLADVDRLRSLEPAALLYTHFGPAPAGDRLERYARVLREWVDAVETIAATAETDAEAIEAVVEAHAPTSTWGEEKGRAEARLNARGVLGYLHR
ncbi:MAG: MBL fold metallo-hydrolase [Halobacteriales archaeon]